MTASRIFFWFCMAFVVGIGISSFLKISQPLLLVFLILGILLISVFWPFDKLRASPHDSLGVNSLPDPPMKSAAGRGRKKIVVIGFCILFLVLGLWRYQWAELKITNNELRKYNNTEEKITFIGTVVKEPDIRQTNTKLTIQPEIPDFHTSKYGSRSENGSRDIDGGRVLVTVARYPEYQYGDRLKITGELKTPTEFAASKEASPLANLAEGGGLATDGREDFNYKDYLAKDKIYSVIYYPEVELIAKNQGSFIFSQILSFKNKLRETIYQNLSPPQSSILGAMILGDKSRMSDDLKEKLNRTGLRHITAISGMHISILTLILMQILIGVGLWRNQAFYLTLIILFLFILMIGFPASAVRAGIFGLMLLLAQKVGRMRVASRVIVFSAVIMLAINPLLLKLDVGFQLSFLAVIGIAYLGPVFRKWLPRPTPRPGRGRGEKKFIYQIMNILSMTLAAQIFTLPILIYNFGRFSLVAPITNILIVSFLSIIMISGFIFVLLGALWSVLGWIISLPVWLLLTYITTITNFFSQLSFSAITLKIHWIWLIIAYIILALLTRHLYKKATLPDYIY